MPGYRTVRRSGLTALWIVALLALSCTGVAAHDTVAWHGSDKAWVDSTHDHLDVQDGECDGNDVYAQGYWWDATISSARLVTVWDTNGCSSGYGHGDGIDFYQYRVCEQGVGCSGWTVP